MNNSSRSAWHGVDKHVLMTLLFRGWTVVGGAVTVLVVPLCLTPMEQGYYYTFTSILALQIFFELGMGQVVMQLVAHEAAHLQQGADGHHDGSPQSVSRLASLRRLLRKWYAVAAMFFLLVAGFAGVMFFRSSELPSSVWLAPWLLLVAATSANLYLSWKIAFVEGFACIKEVNRLRFAQSVAGYVGMWVVLMAGGGLWMAFILPAMAVLFSNFWIRQNPASEILRIDFHDQGTLLAKHEDFNWRQDIFPFQWRIAVSWIAGFFIFQLFTPIVFKFHGAAEAGRIGLGITIFNAVVSVGTSWMAAKAPSIGQMLAKGLRAEASQLFRRLTFTSVALVGLLSLGLVIAVVCLEGMDLPGHQRLPNIWTTVFLALAAVGNAGVMSAAMFMRAHKVEPLLTSSVTLAVATVASVAVLAPVGAEWVLGGYALLVWTLCVPWTAFLLRRFYVRAVPARLPPVVSSPASR